MQLADEPRRIRTARPPGDAGFSVPLLCSPQLTATERLLCGDPRPMDLSGDFADGAELLHHRQSVEDTPVLVGKTIVTEPGDVDQLDVDALPVAAMPRNSP